MRSGCPAALRAAQDRRNTTLRTAGRAGSPPEPRALRCAYNKHTAQHRGSAQYAWIPGMCLQVCGSACADGACSMHGSPQLLPFPVLAVLVHCHERAVLLCCMESDEGTWATGDHAAASQLGSSWGAALEGPMC